MNKLQLFISSAQNEFSTERMRLKDCVNERFSDHFYPFVYETEGSFASSPESIFLDEVARSSLLVLLIGNSIRPFVRAEFEQEKKSEIPALIFVRKGRYSDEVEAFKKSIQDEYGYSDFETIDELLEKFCVSIRNHITLRLKKSANQTSPFADLNLDEQPDWIRDYASKIDAMCDAGEFAKALDICRSKISNSNQQEKFEWMSLQAHIYRRSRDIDKALERYRTLGQLTDKPRFVLNELSTLINFTDNVSPREILESAPANARSHWFYKLLEAQVLLSEGEFCKARQRLLQNELRSRRAAIGPDYYRMLAFCASDQHRYYKAFMILERVIRRKSASELSCRISQAYHLIQCYDDNRMLERRRQFAYLLNSYIGSNVSHLCGCQADERWLKYSIMSCALTLNRIVGIENGIPTILRAAEGWIEPWQLRYATTLEEARRAGVPADTSMFLNDAIDDGDQNLALVLAIEAISRVLDEPNPSTESLSIIDRVLPICSRRSSQEYIALLKKMILNENRMSHEEIAILTDVSMDPYLQRIGSALVSRWLFKTHQFSVLIEVFRRLSSANMGNTLLLYSVSQVFKLDSTFISNSKSVASREILSELCRTCEREFGIGLELPGKMYQEIAYMLFHSRSITDPEFVLIENLRTKMPSHIQKDFGIGLGKALESNASDIQLGTLTMQDVLLNNLLR